MGKLFDYKLVSSNSNKSAEIFDNLFPSQDFTNIDYSSPQDYVSQYWTAYKAIGKKNNVINGAIFEYIIETLLIRSGVLPFYTQVRMAFIPAINYDIILYSENENGTFPVQLSLKTSFRERWKQADLEAEALKNVHRKAKCYLLTLTSSDAKRIKKKIAKGEALAIDAVIDCTSDDIDNLIRELQSRSFDKSLPNISAVKLGNLIC